jgi:hypothetical protein
MGTLHRGAAAGTALTSVGFVSLSLGALALGDTAACSGGSAPAASVTGEAGAPVDAAPEHVRIPYDGLPAPETGPRTAVHSELMTARVDTMQMMFAAGEMQTSGEPFANLFAGRSLQGYLRWYLPPNLYFTQTTPNGNSLLGDDYIDLFGFSSAVESYEYSKYHMNMVANQTGAGVSLANGPLLAGMLGATAFEKLRARMEQLIIAAGTDVGGYATIPDGGTIQDGGLNNPLNDFGFPGIWPNMAPYRSFDPSMTPDTIIAHSCTTVTGYGGVQVYGNNPVPLYECRYNSLRLNDRVAQSEPVIGPGVLGYTTWKEAIWAIDFTGRLHDSVANAVTAVAPQDLALIARPGNRVQGVQPPSARPGTFIGSTPLEGMWGLMMVDESDNAAAWLLQSLATSDGTTLSGFGSVNDALHYDYGSPLVWFPTAIAVTENAATAPPGTPAASYPLVASLAVMDSTSHSVDLAALAQGYSLFFGMTDARNAAVGQQIGLQVAFGGYPFAMDDGLPDGEDTAHDRALGVMRVAFVDLDRIHRDPLTNVIVDTATVGGGSGSAIVRGNTATTTALGHVVVGLRHLLMACNAAVSQYGAPDGDATKDALGILNQIAIHPQGDAAAPPTFSSRVRELLMAQADFVYDRLTQADGTVSNGAALSGGQWSAMTDPPTLEAQSAALRVLAEAWFLAGDAAGAKYQERARAVARKLLTAFWSDPARMFRATAGGPDDVVMTPERFAWLQQALRETYEALWVPGDSLLDRGVLEDRVARVNKLYLNGWDDLNGNQIIDKPAECLGGRLQLGEQALTGELGNSNNGYLGSTGDDRDSDCVPNISASKFGSVLAGQVRFHSP